MVLGGWGTIIASALALIAASPVAAATVLVFNDNEGNLGFNDPTVVAPLPGNPATTLGEQRFNAFQAAADRWGDILVSDVTIRVSAAMSPLSCGPTSGVLGSAGAASVFRDFTGAPRANTWYHSALADALAGFDLDEENPADFDILATFNSDVDDDPNCFTGATWWYGIGVSRPPGTIDFAAVVLHEMGHGLGVSTFVNNSTGDKFLSRDDIYMTFLEDHSTGDLWPSMTNNERAASAIDTGDLHWVGSQVLSKSGILSAGTVGTHVRMYAPSPLEGGSSVSHWDTALSPNELMEPFLTNSPQQILTGALLGDEGWTVRVFGDGFETGDVDRWSSSVP